jgi:hypothetical protein
MVIELPSNIGLWRVSRGWEHWRPPGYSHLRAAFDLSMQWFSGRSGPVWNLWRIHPFANAIALLTFGVAGAIATWQLRQRLFAPRHLLLWFWFIAACAGPVAFDLVRHTYISVVPRYAIAALPAACVPAGIGLPCQRSTVRNVMLVAIVSAWVPNIVSIYRAQSRIGPPVCAIARALTVDSKPSDLVIVESIPSDVLAIVRYTRGPTLFASWVGQLGNRRIPESIHTLAAGCSRILLVRMNKQGATDSPEQWLRLNAIVCGEQRFGPASIVCFRPRGSGAFWLAHG